ncbi:unnamed protein product, partial [marine sediment metagenome]
GFRVEVLDHTGQGVLSKASEVPTLIAVWNGMQTALAKDIEPAKRIGIPVLRLEHGFFDRNRHYQVDHSGILHRASWRRAILTGDPPPQGAAERLARFVPGGIQPQRSKRDGYVLVLGQVTGDSQLADSKIQGMPRLEKAVLRALPRGVPAFFRPHPQCSHIKPHRLHQTLPRLPQENEKTDYGKTKHGAGLTKVLAGARFVVTINSNAITEALAMGVPCLAFGPSLGIDAGAVHPTTPETLKNDLKEMLGGWRAPDAAVRRYLEWLAARQWSADELADPEV